MVSRPQGRATGQGVEDAGESEGRPVIGRIGRCPSRKGAHFQRVSPKAMPLPCGTCRDVRRWRSSNRRQDVTVPTNGPASTGPPSNATYAGFRSGSSGQSERQACAGEEPAKASRSVTIREVAGDPQGDPDQSRQENTGYRRRGVPRAVEPSRDVPERPEPQGLSSEAGAARVHPQSRRKATTLGHTHTPVELHSYPTNLWDRLR